LGVSFPPRVSRVSKPHQSPSLPSTLLSIAHHLNADHLSRAVVTITLATLFRRHEMHLHHSTYFERDVKVHMDKFLARPKGESKGVFVVIDK